MTKRITATFLRGLAAILPVTVTIYAVVWLAITCEDLLRLAMHQVLPNVEYFPGLGIVAGVCVVYLVGFLLQIWLAAAIFRLFEAFMEKVPLIHTVYSSLKDLLGFFVGNKEDKPSQVVMVTIAGVRMMGFVTRDRFDDLPGGVGGSHEVAVYLPMSYQIGGFTVMVPRDEIQPVDMTSEQALRFCVTAGVTASKDNGPRRRRKSDRQLD